MLNLILKDILVQKRTIVFAFLYSIFMFFVFSQPPLSQFIYSMVAVAISYIFILTALQADFKNNTIIIFNSLPVKRSEIVASKYLSLFVFIALSLSILVIVGLLVKVSPLPFDVRYPRLYDLVITLLSVGILISVYMPVYFKTGSRWVQIINILFFMLIFFAPSTVFSCFMEKQHQPFVKSLIQYSSENVLLVYLMAVIITLIILAVSFTCSLRIYLKKDF
jgi:ABC-type transport system involved in multi-copper enzyme maturation permease subunit